MAFDLKKIRALAEEAAETGPDYNEQRAGGDYTPPAAGGTRLRFIEYVEVGVHTKSSRLYGDKTKPMAQFGFELSGPKHPPREIDGKKYPHIIRFEEPIGQGAKNNYSKLFLQMVKDFPGRKNFGQLLGEAFRGEVFHREYEGGGGKRVSAELKSKDKGYSIASTLYEDPDTGEPKRVKVDMPLSPYRFLEWSIGDVDMWDSVFIDGTYDDGNTKNKVQERIKAAENFVGSPVYNALVEAGREAELEPAAVVERSAQPEGEKEADAEPEAEPVQEAPKKAPAKPVAAPKPAAKAKAPVPAKAAAKPVKSVAPPADDSDDNDPLAGL